MLTFVLYFLAHNTKNDDVIFSKSYRIMKKMLHNFLFYGTILIY